MKNGEYIISRSNNDKEKIYNWGYDEKVLQFKLEQFDSLNKSLKDKNVEKAFNILESIFDENISLYFKSMLDKFINENFHNIDFYINKWKTKYKESKMLINFRILIGVDLIK